MTSGALRRSVAATILLIAGYLIVTALKMAPGIDRHMYLICGWGAIGCAVGWLLATTDWLAREPEWAAIPAVQNTAASVLTASIGGLTYWCGMRHFGGFDHGMMVDLGWRLASGQKPYVDFPCTFPPAFALGAGHAFSILGVQWRSLVIVACLFGMGAFIWSVYLLRRITGHHLQALVFAFFVQATTTMLVAYWWYNPITTIAATLLLLSAAVLLQAPDRRSAWISYTAALVLVAGMKPNVAGPIIALNTVVLLASKATRLRVLACSAAAFLIFVIVLAAHSVDLRDVIGAYTAISGRGFSLTQFMQDLSFEEKAFSLLMFLLMLAPLVGALTGVRALLPRQRVQFLAVGAWLAGGYGFFTNGEIKIVDFPLLLLGALLYTSAIGTERAAFVRYFGFLAALISFVALGEAVTRHRVRGIGYGAFFEYQPSPRGTQNNFFADVTIGPTLVGMLEEIKTLLTRHPDRNVYFGPRMQWAYAAFDRRSPVGQPLEWNPGVAFARSSAPVYLQRWSEQKFDVLVFRKGDFTYFTPEFMELISSSYTFDNQYSYLGVYHRTK